MDRRTQALGIATLLAVIVRYLYAVAYRLMAGLGFDLSVSLSSVMLTVLVVLVSGGLALWIAKRPLTWAIWSIGLGVFISQGAVYLDTQMRFPGALANLEVIDFVLQALQWVIVCGASFALAAKIWHDRLASADKAQPG